MNTIPRNDNVTVGGTVIEISPELTNATRELISLTNVSTGGQVINIAWGQNAEVGKGVQLGVGANWTESQDAVFKPSQLRISAIANAAGGVLAVHERLR